MLKINYQVLMMKQIDLLNAFLILLSANYLFIINIYMHDTFISTNFFAWIVSNTMI